MSHVFVHDERMNLQNPVFVEGLPGVGLVGKLAIDHLVSELEMTYYASIECPGLPPVAAYRSGQRTVVPPVRIYADQRRDLLALQSDVPVSPQTVSDFASCLTGFVANHDALPLYSSGLVQGPDGEPSENRAIYGIATGYGGRLLADNGVEPPTEDGIWSGPTGSLLSVARANGLTALGLIVETHPQFPDPEAACRFIERVVAPVADIRVDVGALREREERIREEKRALAESMGRPDHDESSRAESLRMYQ